MDDYGINYSKRRLECLPIDLSPNGPYWEIFDLWQSKIQAAKERTLAKNPHPNLWDLSESMAVLHLFASKIERETWKKLTSDLCDFLGLKFDEQVPIKF